MTDDAGIQWSDVKTKVVTWSITGIMTALAAGGLWLKANMVLAADMEKALAAQSEMIASELQAVLAPLTNELRQTNALARQNAEDIRQGRIQQTQSSIRSLTAAIEEMQVRKSAGGPWTQSDDTLLEIWQEDLAGLQDTLENLTAVPRTP